MRQIIHSIRKNISNVPGWRTSRKIIVIESDDWGSVRIRDHRAYEALLSKGLNVDRIHYDKYESLESNQDLEQLFDLLSSFKDINGKHPVFTALCIMGNPDFNKILSEDFHSYFFQPLRETINEYSNSDRLLDLWRHGKSLNIFVPELHGREHVNVRRYMDTLNHHEGKDGLRFALTHHSVGPTQYLTHKYPNILGALHPQSTAEIPELHQYIVDAGQLFEQYMGYKPRVFIAPNAEEPKELESTLKEIGIKYITRSKKRVFPVGDGRYQKEWNFFGKKNEHDQIILNRNSFFEPVCYGEQQHITDWVDSCLQDVDSAFRWHKPAVISSHRVNYVGSINQENRKKGLAQLNLLLSKILKRWPDVEFMSSFELGETIKKEKYPSL
jgi:hypothetical protein